MTGKHLKKKHSKKILSNVEDTPIKKPKIDYHTYDVILQASCPARHKWKKCRRASKGCAHLSPSAASGSQGSGSREFIATVLLPFLCNSLQPPFASHLLPLLQLYLLFTSRLRRWLRNVAVNRMMSMPVLSGCWSLEVHTYYIFGVFLFLFNKQELLSIKQSRATCFIFSVFLTGKSIYQLSKTRTTNLN